MFLLHRFLKANTGKPFLVACLLVAGIAAFAVTVFGAATLLTDLLIALAYGTTGYAIFLTGRITRYRKLVFIFFALFIFSAAALNAWLARAATAATCPIALAATTPAACRSLAYHVYAGTLFLPGLVLLAAILLTGRLWCSWLCPLGGTDEFFATLMRQPLVLWRNMPDWLSELPAAVLLFSVITTLASGTAVFCRWLCPYLPLHTPDAHTVLPALAAGLIFLVLIVVLPLATKKRSFCRLLCPLRGLLRLTGNLHPLKLSINKTACTACGTCRTACTSLAIEPDYTISGYCTFCLACVEACPANAIETEPPLPALLFVSVLLAGISTVYFLHEVVFS